MQPHNKGHVCRRWCRRQKQGKCSKGSTAKVKVQVEATKSSSIKSINTIKESNLNSQDQVEQRFMK